MSEITTSAVLSAESKIRRHSWAEPTRFQFKTERQCVLCGLIKVSRHEEIVWIEYWRDDVRLDTDKTPPCEGTR